MQHYTPQLTFHTPIKDLNNYQYQYSQVQNFNNLKNFHSYKKQTINYNIESQQQQNEQGQQQKEQNYQKIIKNYILGQTIGQGTFNKVKIAKHTLTNQKVAIKIIDKSSIQNQADKKRLNIQLKILRKVRHPYIGQLYQILQDKQNLYLVTQYVQRGQLFQYIVSQQRLSQFQASKFLQQLLDAIQYVHSLGVAHRDLKPQNLLLDYKYNIKLIDFGLSNIYSQGQLLKTACGSPCYASPQMLKGKPYDGLKSDIWSIGIVLYAMVFGYLPFDNSNTAQLYKSISRGEYQITQHASKQLISILKITLQVDPQKRATINQIRNHIFCKLYPLSIVPGIIVGLSDIPYEQCIQNQIITQIYININEKQKLKIINQLKHSIKFNKHNQLSSTYYLILKRNLRIKNLTVINYYTQKNNSINRYSIAQKVKQIYQKRLKQRLENSRKQYYIQSQSKNNKSQQKNNKSKQKQQRNSKSKQKQQRNSKSKQKIYKQKQNINKFKDNINSKSKQNTIKKINKNQINIVKLNRTGKIQKTQRNIKQNSLKNQSNKKLRQIKTTNNKKNYLIVKNKESDFNKKINKRTKLDFNQIQFSQKQLFQQTFSFKNKNSGKKALNQIQQSQNIRKRNKSLNIIKKQTIPIDFKVIQTVNDNITLSNQKKRSKSQNYLNKKINNFKQHHQNKKYTFRNNKKKTNIKRQNTKSASKKIRNQLIYEMTD